jgi:glutathione S-transferase
LKFIVDLFRDAGLFPYENDELSALRRARAKQFVEVFNTKINALYYNAVVRGEVDVGPALIESIKTFIVPLLPDSQFILGDKFGLAEILCAPFVIRIYLLVKLGILGNGVEEKMAQIEKWSKWARAVLANESVRKTFNYEYEARKAVDRIRKIREMKKLNANDANVANGSKV